MAFANLVLLVGPLLLTGGILNYLLTPLFVKLISERLLLIEPGTIYYEKWIKTPVPLSVNLYLFDIQNPYEIMRGAKPIVKEIGPYSFSQTREKTVLKYSADRETVTYMETKIFKFDRDKSVGDLGQRYLTPNIPFLSAIKVWNGYLKNFPLSMIVQPLAERFLSTIMEYYQQNLFINVTVDQIMFKGLHLNFVPLLQSLAQTFGRFGIGGEIAALSNNSFSFFKYINHTMNGPYEVYTGHWGLSKLAQLKKYKDKAVLDVWPDAECNTVKGSDGIQFTPFKKDKSNLYVFSHEFCRVMTLEYKRNSEVRGIRTYRYEPAKELFSKKNADNKCECTDSYRCKYSGLIDLSPCWYKAPLYASVPHFTGEAFDDLRKSIIGMKPDESKHKSFLDLDPITGSSLRGSKRGQLNAYIEKISSVRSIRAVKDELFIPLFWYEEYGEINDELENEIKMKSVYPLMLTNHFTLFALIVGSILSLLSCIFCMCCRKCKRKVHCGAADKKDRKDLVYLNNNYQRLTNLEDAESTKTNSSTTSSEHMKAISIISNGSIDSLGKSGFILVQPIRNDKQQVENHHHHNHHDIHSLALVPYQSFKRTPKLVNEYVHPPLNGSITQNSRNMATFKSQIENNNYIESVDYQAPSAEAIDESMKVISRILELNKRNLAKNEPLANNLQLVPANLIPIHHLHQQDNSINELTVNHHRPKLVKQSSSQDSFD